jgi:hypothetical protein
MSFASFWWPTCFAFMSFCIWAYASVPAGKGHRPLFVPAIAAALRSDFTS